MWPDFHTISTGGPPFVMFLFGNKLTANDSLKKKPPQRLCIFLRVDSANLKWCDAMLWKHTRTQTCLWNDMWPYVHTISANYRPCFLCLQKPTTNNKYWVKESTAQCVLILPYKFDVWRDAMCGNKITMHKAIDWTTCDHIFMKLKQLIHSVLFLDFCETISDSRGWVKEEAALVFTHMSAHGF